MLARYVTLAVALTTLLLFTSHAFAEDDQEVKLKGVTVTAQKREENVQDVPVSMNVVTGIDIEEARITDLSELIQYTPNVFSTQSLDNRSMVIRGISTMNTALSPAVGLFVDDIPYAINRMQNPALLDVERVEVLRGPQGTLYGKNTESGAINIITRQPDNELRGKIFGEYGFYDIGKAVPLYRAGGNVSGPILEDELFVGVAFQGKTSDSYMENIYDGDKSAAEYDQKIGRVSLRWTPAQVWDISFIVDAEKNNNKYAWLRYESGAGASDKHKSNWNGGNDWDTDSNNQVLKAKYSGKHFDLLSITSRSDYRTEILNDADFGPFNFGNQDFTFDCVSYNQELRLSSPNDGKALEWLVGLFGSKDKTFAKSHTPAYFAVRDTDIDIGTVAVFGQATYTLFDSLHLTVGTRYEHQNLEGKQTNQFAATPKYSHSETNDEFLPKLSIAYDLTDDIMAYGTYSKGFLSGGYNFHMGNNADDMYFKPEHTTSYEAGFKSVFWDSRLTVNAALFHIDIKDKQVIEWPVGGAPTLRRVSNAAQASSNGLELEVSARPWNEIEFFGGVGYTEAKFDNWVAPRPGGNSFDYKGKYLPNAPKYTYNLGAQYRAMNGLFLRGDLLGTGSYYCDSENTQKVDGYKTVNLKVGYSWEDVDAVLWANNVFNESYVVSRMAYMGSLVQDGEPRSTGLTLTYRF
nr:TonB-dependent receptor [Pseudodesulfovibrio sp.]